ncbi:hypothetical protein BOTBODRAFT_193070 [Botryobasidium botryosum FD-172 SS1]|uniref:F-box domain-containing protein n=1 Tax=Botryobasidium botryosum (strain FD-172 SS1) TaxID=930990 RepID=A0A067LVV8_BOTB1|nr:hypothetical protein BOTBODRAFT_193070 [Botryobasidium botryosum FD-172 SS1]
MDAAFWQIRQLVDELVQQATPQGAHKIDRSRDSEEIFKLLDHKIDTLTSFRDRVDAYLQNAIIEIKSHRNQHTPISRFPPEIYSRIFEFACTEAEVDCGSIMLVSKLWRDIALSTPSLWTRINGGSAEFIATCILRSKNAPLEIELPDFDSEEVDPDILIAMACTPEEQRFKEQMAPLTPQIHRWRCLTLENIRPRHFWPEFCMAAPQLEMLDLALASYYPHDTEAPPPGALHDLFAGATPRLRSLRLGRISVPLTSSIYRGLENLSIIAVDLHDATADDFLDVLKACPRLSSLQLNTVQMSGPTLGPQSTIKLPRLSLIDISTMPCHAIRHIFSSIISPSLKGLSVMVDLDDDEAIHDALPFDMAANFMRTVENIRIDRLLFQFHASRGGEDFFNVVGGNSETPSALYLWSTSSSLDSLLRGLFPRISSTFNLRDLTALSVVGLPESDTILTDFRQLLVHCGELRRLTLKDCWSSIPISLRRVGADGPPCPKLSELSISSSTPIDGWDLIEMVRTRQAVLENSQEVEDVTALQVLRITNPRPLDEEVVQALRGLVPNIELKTA